MEQIMYFFSKKGADYKTDS